MALHDQIEAAIEAASWGRPNAVKRGRNPAYPYVPVMIFPERTQNLTQGVAFATRDEAISYGERYINHCKKVTAARLAEPRNRSLRQQYGLPRELSDCG